MNETTIIYRRQQVLYDTKWKKFIKRSRAWRYIPFVEFVLGAGSMATGNVHDTSDFDVIVGVRNERIFTARFCSVILFGALGWRRKKAITHVDTAKDKICLNHFVTDGAYALAPPHNAYWQMLYSNLIPLYGSEEKINAFFKANEFWMKDKKIHGDDIRHGYRTASSLKKGIENLLDKRVGSTLERGLKKMQIHLIEQGIGEVQEENKPRIKYDDTELEFHPDTRRIDEHCKMTKIS
jgi:hypothetical protein